MPHLEPKKNTRSSIWGARKRTMHPHSLIVRRETILKVREGNQSCNKSLICFYKDILFVECYGLYL